MQEIQGQQSDQLLIGSSPVHPSSRLACLLPQLYLARHKDRDQLKFNTVSFVSV